MNPERKTLLLFTSAFPYGKGEQFIETEIRFLAASFKEVHIYPLDQSGEKRELPSNVSVRIHKLYQPYSRIKLMLRRGGTILSWFRQQKRISRHKHEYRNRKSHHLNFLMHRIADAEQLGNALNAYDSGSTVVYSYWFNVWTMVLLFARQMGLHKHKVLTRAHGGDLDEQQRKSGYFPFRSLEMEMADRVVPVSEYGQKLLCSLYPKHVDKIGMSHLGVSSNGLNPPGEETKFRIVTCSFVYGLKRLHLIPQILSKLNFPVEWVHFGEGELLPDLKMLAAKLPSNVNAVFRGHVPNREILDYYSQHRVDLFMNVSELEGIPVSIMEAISFGIPVTGCAICGVPEIVTEQTGFLFVKDFKVAEAARKIESYYHLSPLQKMQFRVGVRQFWEQNFNAELNYPEFIRNYLLKAK